MTSSTRCKSWPTISIMQLESVYKWYINTKIYIRQKSICNLDRSIYSLQSVISRNDYVRETDILYLSSALESIFNLPNYNILTLFINRVKMFLNEPTNNKKSIIKNIRDFYDFRSRIVHGDFNIISPLQNEIFDRSVDETRNKIFWHFDIGFSILIATLQKMVNSSLHELNFIEVECHTVL